MPNLKEIKSRITSWQKVYFQEVKNLTLLYIYDNGEVEIVHRIK